MIIGLIGSKLNNTEFNNKIQTNYNQTKQFNNKTQTHYNQTKQFKLKEINMKKYIPLLIEISVIVFIALLIAIFLFGCPKYNVWRQGLAGQVELAKAEQNRKIKIQEAEAIRDSALLLAEAEIEKAKGIAEVNKIIGNSLKDNEPYLRWLWIDKLNENGQNVIYIPIEAGMPILETRKRR